MWISKRKYIEMQNDIDYLRNELAYLKDIIYDSGIADDVKYRYMPEWFTISAKRMSKNVNFNLMALLDALGLELKEVKAHKEIIKKRKK